jgi:DNA-binding MarR family transcriptional regulator
MENIMAVLSVEECIGERSPGRLLRRVNKQLLLRMKARFSDADLSFVDFMAIKLIRDGVSTNAGELARDMHINTGATTRLIDGLEQKGLLERDRSSADRRVVRLRLTQSGEGKYIEKVPIMVAQWNEVLASFDQSEADMLMYLLSKMLASMERITNNENLDQYQGVRNV